MTPAKDPSSCVQQESDLLEVKSNNNKSSFKRDRREKSRADKSVCNQAAGNKDLE